jgi:hypothetical protein
MFTPDFLKIDQVVQKWKWTQTPTHNMAISYVSCFSLNESRLKSGKQEIKDINADIT